MTGIERIAAERKRQVEKEGWTAEHDDKHAGGQLAIAAACYTLPSSMRAPMSDTFDDTPLEWPWDWGWWKPTPCDRIRELEKAGALIAAEIDRLLRQGR